MVNIETINQAIAAHGLWKQRLREAIKTGVSEWTVEQVRVDNHCAFGKWLYSFTQTEQQDKEWETIRALHANFHKEAAQILELALSGKQQEAENALGLTGAFAQASSALTLAMVQWRDSLLKKTQNIAGK